MQHETSEECTSFEWCAGKSHESNLERRHLFRECLLKSATINPSSTGDQCQELNPVFPTLTENANPLLDLAIYTGKTLCHMSFENFDLADYRGVYNKFTYTFYWTQILVILYRCPNEVHLIKMYKYQTQTGFGAKHVFCIWLRHRMSLRCLAA